MHAAPLTSPRLQRVLAVLGDGRAHTTRDIVRRGRVMAVNACVAELRAHGAEISCTARIITGRRRFFYLMTKGPEVASK
ncbi:MAG: hypothetical protein CVT86_05725 [Alphaproteobacteria bacterium HGW-Alphaproteobacteria-8]|jgi:hypothetical protein|nr:MAG: hypothetical protein CVT86_05725 [Alphaproteobacteria bacterium HGW-Alphaproteobacteria-8]PKP71873.1 MAG: hypothetical protein CVT82_00460 [Alphaproteobacteria bacterium HGW-Alphaproteobacteria-4]